jgi:beta-glucosidase
MEDLSLEQKVRLLTGADFWSLHPEPAIGLRRIVMSDGPAGVRGERWDEREPSANVPSPTALAATWDEARIERLGRLLAYECRRKGVDILLAPTVNLHRSPFGGRHFECFSEDPLLTARIGAAYVRGLQSEGVAATVKHFVANDSETERFTLDARVDERTLRELYLAPFELMLEAEPWAIMAAYNAVNGETMTESSMLAELRERWDGLVMSDWGAARHTERTANAALDLVMPGPSGPWGDALVQAVREGRVSEAAVDEKVRRLLRLAERVSAREASPWSDEEIASELRATAAAGIVLARNHGTLLPFGPLRKVAVLGPNAAVARTLGGGSATVFPHYTVSPLEALRDAFPEVTHSPGVRAYTRLPVADVSAEVRYLAADGTVLSTERRETGQFAWMGTLAADIIEVHATVRAERAGEHVIGCSGPGRHRLWLDGAEAFDVHLELPDGADPGAALFFPPQHGVPVTLAAGQEVAVVLRHEVVAGDLVTLQLNVDPPFGDDELERAVELAREADAAVVVVGTTAEVESEGFDRTSLALPGRQDELIRRVANANPRTVVVVNAGAPVLMPWLAEVPAVLLAWFPGQEAGNAIADVILGRAEPGGRLPTTWPTSEEGHPSVTPADGVLSYDEGLAIGYRGPVEPLLPFGHGLGYTTWEYLAMDGARVRLANTGTRPGREVVQVYASRPDSAVARPPRWLAGFAVVEADAGQEVIVDVPLSPRAFQHWDGGWKTEPGAFVLEAGRSVADLRLRSALEP